MSESIAEEATTRKEALPRGALGAWWAQGARSIFFRAPQWHGLALTPAVLAILWLVPVAVAVGVERLAIDGPARFYWPTLLSSGWMNLVILLALSWWLVQGKQEPSPKAQDPLSLLAMVYAQMLPLQLVLALVMVPLVRRGAFSGESDLLSVARTLWIAGMVWLFAAQGVLLWRGGAKRTGPFVVAFGIIVGSTLLQQFYTPLRHWYPARPEVDEAEKAPSFRLTQEVVEAQSQVLAQDLMALKPERPGHIDLFAITYAPDADEDVFLRESALVDNVMRARFDASGRSLQLVSRRDQVPHLAWATPTNLQRAIARVATLMNREEDVLFIHLTSHGARNGELASSMYPLEVENLTPQQLVAWLDAAGIRHRVISVSACFSGSWVAPLAGEDTLVMTAADADHTSYGCGRLSEVTFFGRAMFDEQLRKTWSFEQAHAAARLVIDQREKEAKKSDGFSNPQISVGPKIRETLARLALQLGGT